MDTFAGERDGWWVTSDRGEFPCLWKTLSLTLSHGAREWAGGESPCLWKTLSHRAREADQGAQVGSGVQTGRSVAQAWWRDMPR